MTLSQLTMAQFVDVACGDVSAISSLFASKSDIERERLRLMYEFAELSDPPSAARYIGARAQKIKRRAELQIFRVCHNLVEIGALGEAREILAQYGLRASSLGEGELKSEIAARMKRAERDIAVEDGEEEEAKEQTPEEMRLGYDRQCASLMAYFKFQIDMATMKASQFACLIAQASMEIKAKQAALQKKP